LQNPFGLPPPLPTPPLPVEVPVPPSSLGLLARLLALLPEAGVAAALATLLPTNSPDDPGYQSEWDLIRRYTPPTDKDRAELADLERRHAEGTLTAEEEAHLLALLARVKGLYLQQLADLRQVVPEYIGVEIITANNAVLGEFDGINMREGLFIEDKSADGLTMVNPRTGLNSQTSEEWARKHVFTKTNGRISGLKSAAATRPTNAGTPTVPAIDQIRNFCRLHFRVEADTPEVRQAVEKEIQKLTLAHPDWDFTADYGK
jgi:hypothetical protein